MMRRGWAGSPLNESLTAGCALAALNQRRGLKTLDVREYKPTMQPMEFKAYQRFTNHSMHQGGIMFNSHYEDYHRWRVRGKNGGLVDFLNWGRETGQAHLPFRHQRTAFDFHDTMHPTRLPRTAAAGGWFEGQDPTMGPHAGLASEFDPNMRPWSEVENYNHAFGNRRDQRGLVRLPFGWEPKGIQWQMTRATDTLSPEQFGNAELSNPHDYYMYAGFTGKLQSMDKTKTPSLDGRIPGIHVPFKGEHDGKLMQAMAQPTDALNNVCRNDGRFSKCLYLNRPERNQNLTQHAVDALDGAIDESTNGFMSKLVTLQAAQSGQTDFFCGGVDMDVLAHNMQMRQKAVDDAAALKAERDRAQKKSPRAKELDIAVHSKIAEARQYVAESENLLRKSMTMLWRVFGAPRPFMTIINGKARNVGAGLALLSKFPVLRDSTEFLHDGPHLGITPFGGMTHLLSRTETSMKYPGLAEYVMLTGAPLYAGDALRLGWSDLFTTLPDMDYHIKEWFDSTEHMHNDAVAWQLGHLLDTTMKMKGTDHATTLERTALSTARAKWIEEIFADQPSVEAIMDTLSQVEQLPLDDPNNTRDLNRVDYFTLENVSQGVQKLQQQRLAFSLEPWDITESPVKADNRQVADVFREYVFERSGSVNIAAHKNATDNARWRKHREEEYFAFKRSKRAPMKRSVFVRVEGPEGKLIRVDYVFDKSRVDAGKTAEQRHAAMLADFREQVLAALGMPAGRPLQLAWFMPTLDTAAIRSDEELLQVLQNDPGIEDMANPTPNPPLYLYARRQDVYLSEWAYAVKHKLLLSSPFALKASFQLLKDIRRDGAEGSVQSVSESLATEFRYAVRLMKRPDFWRIGMSSQRSAEEWDALQSEQDVRIDRAVSPVRPVTTFADAFDKNVTVDGHHFVMRPKWSPRTIAEVNDADVAALSRELNFVADGVVEAHVPVECQQGKRIIESVNEVGLEIVPGLGEKELPAGKKAPAPLVGDAHVPTNVNFYEMARHPWLDQQTSWRAESFTEGSEALFHRKYKEAEAALYDEHNNGSYNYFASEKATEGVLPDKDEVLLQDRFWSAIKAGEQQVEGWARNLRKRAKDGDLKYEVEITSTEEKVFDDEYYRWFIAPGEHPNPSGLLRHGKVAVRIVDSHSGADGAEEEEEQDDAAVQGGTEPVAADDPLPVDPAEVGAVADADVEVE